MWTLCSDEPWSAAPFCTGAVLCCAVFCCTLLTVLTVLRCAVLCCAVLRCCAVLCCAALLCCAVLCCAVLCCAVLCCAVLQVWCIHFNRVLRCRSHELYKDAQTVPALKHNLKPPTLAPSRMPMVTSFRRVGPPLRPIGAHIWLRENFLVFFLLW